MLIKTLLSEIQISMISENENINPKNIWEKEIIYGNSEKITELRDSKSNE